MIAAIAIFVLIGVWLLWVYHKENLLEHDGDILRLKNRLLPYFPEFNRVKLMKGDSSYTINKYRVFICMRDRNTNVLYDDNMLTYVALHELAHSICTDIGHTEQFHDIFTHLLDRAEALSLYDPNIPRPMDYCR
jgi:hypothetical protein